MDPTTDDASSKESKSSISAISDVVPDNLTLPTHSAGPDEVRSYLRQLLLNRGCIPDLAQQTVAKWTKGNGKKLRKAELRIYRELFGLDGLTVYEEVQTACIRAHNAQTRIWTGEKIRFSSIGAFGVVLVVTGAVLVKFTLERGRLLYIPIVLISLGLFLVLVGSIVVWDRRQEIVEERGLRSVLQENHDLMNGARGTI